MSPKFLDQTGLTFDDVLLVPGYADFKRDETDISVKLSDKITLAIPLLSAPMDTVTNAAMAIKLGLLGGLGIIHRNMPVDTQSEEVRIAKKDTKLVGAAVGVGKDLSERIDELVKVGVDAVVVDSAHGYSKYVIEATKYVKEHHKHLFVIAGNVATKEGAEALIEAGASCIRVGMGPGAICTTRIISGMGVPQLSAVMDVVQVSKTRGISMIADGGIRYSGDVVKAMAAGADLVMIGSLFAGTLEAPGEMIEKDGKKYKSFRGMGSISAMKEGSAARYGQEYRKGQERKLIPEGIASWVPYRGTMEDVVTQLVGGLRTGMYYTGCRTIADLQTKTQFLRITQASLAESFPHDVIMK